MSVFTGKKKEIAICLHVNETNKDRRELQLRE